MKITSNAQKESYKRMLKSAGALSRLSSDSSTPYIGYRIAENAFCLAFDADNLSRSDCSADAAKDNIGYGIKTFLNGTGRTLQKVAEFNKDAELFSKKQPVEIVEIVAHLRNERLRATKRIYKLDELIYHCIVREEGKIKVYETPMDEIDIKSIKAIDAGTKNTISFKDSKNEYSINLSKSTLYKRFITENVDIEVDVDILDNPFDVINGLLGSQEEGLIFTEIINDKDYIFLPLFSDKGGRHVPERSGLNQWNAKGRPRKANEVYIPIPAFIHKKFPGFFPGHDEPFQLILPDKRILSAKLCQENSKALMTNPNDALGEWLLRDVMALEERELLSYEKLQELGLDSVVVYKESDGTYSIDFTEIGSFDEFVENVD